VKASNLLFVIIPFIIFCGCNDQSKKKSTKYTDYDRGYYFLYYKKYDSAFEKFNSYVNNPDDSLNKGKAYRYMGEMLWKINDLYKAQENLARAIQTLKSLDAEQLLQTSMTPVKNTYILDSLDSTLRLELGAAYNIEGNVNMDLNLYDEALSDYNKAIATLKDLDYIFEPLNGKATTFQKMGKFNNAIAVYDSIGALNPGDPLIMARVTDNKARTQWMQNSSYPALPAFWSALNTRISKNDTSGLHASYAHLSEYYIPVNPDSALFYAQKRFKQATDNKTPADIVDAADKLFYLSHDVSSKDFWHTKYRNINDTLQRVKDVTRNRFALITLEVSEIKADNLALQKHINWQRILMFILAAFAAVIISGLSFWYGKRRRKIRQEADNAIRDSKLKTSQKVHDVVANGLYGIMNELEHGKTIEREPLIDKIEGLYEKSRNISYEDIASANDIDHDKEVYRLLISFANEQTKVIIAGDQQTFWSRITPVQKQELQLVLNELMVNMKKHSRAKKVMIQFKEDDNKALITYQDDGTGFPPGLQHGNGLKHTVNRINSLHGEVNFGKSELGGASIAISFPLQSSQT
jgi:tetratricopeptide (TPR) repeat protein